MESQLNIYTIHNHFILSVSNSIAKVCNAPTDKSGVYLVYEVKKECEELIYIGRSGKKKPDGTLMVRKAGLGGMKDRIVNGHQFGKIPRKKSWISKMIEEKINLLHIKWWVTFDDTVKDFPEDIENMLLNKYFALYKRLPRWNKAI